MIKNILRNNIDKYDYTELYEIFMNVMVKPNENSEPQRVNSIIKFFVDAIEDLMQLLRIFKETAEDKL